MLDRVHFFPVDMFCVVSPGNLGGKQERVVKTADALLATSVGPHFVGVPVESWFDIESRPVCEKNLPPAQVLFRFVRNSCAG